MRQSLTFRALAGLATAVLSLGPALAQPGPGDIPSHFERPADTRDYVERVVMIPMRDGVKLNTLILMPKGAKAAPIVLTRTPYDAKARTWRTDSPRLAERLPLVDEDMVRAGYIRVYQDVRGKYGSEGAYDFARPARGPLNATRTDHATDAWDTIDWLVKNVPESNGKVGMIGSSYGGFTVAMALLDPHPALKAAVSESPLVDGWMGDDWFHYGAFRQTNFDYVAMQTAQKGAGGPVPRAAYDDYETFLEAGSAGAYAAANGLEQLPWWRKVLDHPSYDAFWQAQALDKLLARHPSDVPTLWEQGLWDQEDMWGANHAFAALKAAGHEANNWLVIGPWRHSQVALDGWSLGPFNWAGDTSLQFRRDMVMPFFDQYLRGGPPANLPRARVYDPAENRWESFNDWPSACATGCAHPLTPLYLQPDFGLGFARPPGHGAGDAYVSDPARPVPYLPRPVRFGDEKAWGTWLVRDQRFVDGRPDVLVYRTPPLTTPVKIEGAAVADIWATTTGTDGDFVVKLIDVYPPLDPDQPELGGYELSVAGDIFRGRFRDSFEHPTAIPPGQPQRYRFVLPNQNYVFKPGHRIMVQVQSTLFPLYDRNPQSFVANPQLAKPADYQKAAVTILRSGDQASAVWLPITP